MENVKFDFQSELNKQDCRLFYYSKKRGFVSRQNGGDITSFIADSVSFREYFLLMEERAFLKLVFPVEESCQESSWANLCFPVQEWDFLFVIFSFETQLIHLRIESSE